MNKANRKVVLDNLDMPAGAAKPELPEGHGTVLPTDGCSLSFDLDTLQGMGIEFHYDSKNVLHFWNSEDSEPCSPAFAKAMHSLCYAGMYNGLETGIMQTAIRRAELTIRMMRVLQGK